MDIVARLIYLPVDLGIIFGMLTFQYHPELLGRYPNIVGGVILARGLEASQTPPALADAYQAEQSAVLARIGEAPLSELESLAAWRSAFRQFGVNPTKYRSAVEALLRRLTKKGDIPGINTLVDICNLVSIRYQLPVAAFDARAFTGAITVRFARGDESFTPLGSPEPENPDPGEVIFADKADLVIARRWCWRQSDESAAGQNTQAAIFTVEAQHPGGRTAVQSALTDLDHLLANYAGGARQSGLLDAANHSISWKP